MPLGFTFYRGPSADAIDWSAPLASTGIVETAVVCLPLTPGVTEVLAVRQVSAAGVEESNCHVLAHVCIDAGGELVPVLAAPRDVAVWQTAAGEMAVSFRYIREGGLPLPDALEVLSDHGTGQLDLDEPVLIIRCDPAQASQERFAIRLPLECRPIRIAVRAAIGAIKGPPSPSAVLPAASDVVPAAM